MKKIIIILMLLFSSFLLSGQEKTFKDIFLSGGNMWITDATGTDSVRIYDDGDTTRINSDNPFQMNQSLTVPGSSLYIGNVKLEDKDGCLATNEFHAHGSGSVAGYLKLKQGTTPTSHKEASHSILWTDSSEDLYFEKADGTDTKIIKDDGSGNVDINGSVIIKAGIPGTVGSHPAGQLIIQNPANSVLSNAVITGYESDGSGNPDQQLWYLGSSSVSNSDVLLLNRRASNLHLGTNDLTRMTIDAGGDIYTVAWTDYGGTSMVVGFSGTPTVNIWYKKIGNLVYVNFYISGTSDDTPFTFTLPYTNVNDTNSRIHTAIKFKDNNTQSTIPGQIYLAPNTNIAVLYTDWAAQIWTPANTKEAMGQFWFEAQ